MRGVKLILFGISVLLLGVCATLLSGLQLPTYHNGIYEILGLVCPVFGTMLAVWGVFAKDEAEKDQDQEQDKDENKREDQ